jgi:ABC-type sugar transport system ATPase subunit
VNPRQLQHRPLRTRHCPEQVPPGRRVSSNAAVSYLPPLDFTWSQFQGQEQRAGNLSGGNQQKVVLAKWLARNCEILVFDEPTRGVDIGAKQEIYRLMEELASRGVAVLFVSSDLEEILGMSDRTLVLHEGRLSGELSRAELSEEAVMQLATGAGGGPP